jgi:hypothetical protein
MQLSGLSTMQAARQGAGRGAPHAAEREADAVDGQQPQRQEQRMQQRERRVHRLAPAPPLRQWRCNLMARLCASVASTASPPPHPCGRGDAT